jgi:phosphate acetyltransferase
VDKVREAMKLAQEKAPHLQIDGEMQGDAALVPLVAEKKFPKSRVAGHANVLVFPDLDAANIAYKLVQYLGRAEAYGPLVQGLSRTGLDLSRGATPDDIVGVIAVAALRAEHFNEAPLAG